MKLMGFGKAVVLSSSIAAISAGSNLAGAPAQRASNDSKEVVIIGCVVKGDGGYVLTDVAEETTLAAVSAGTPTTAQPSGAFLPGRVLYWLKDDDEVDEHAGHKLEVRGKLDGDIEKGKISAEREGGVIELEFKVEGEKKVTIKVPDVPASIGTGGKVGDKEVDFPYVVRRIDVKSVKMITSTCR